MKYALLLTGVVTLALAPATYAMRCGTGVVQVGDYESEVNQKCGQPVQYDFVVIRPWGAVKKSIYSMGRGKFFKVLIFDDDRLVNISNGSRE
ncbi:hypothetical protein CKO31_24935 [Thiohalocapsa halophila]|uniref:DUF2845 domain-containing protein n=2 Tax=Thiohalocapsa halophila TaxID=69359 RepID=A0ABS1CPQ3_9GAMM|nr:hypothetical protein [Thiohalocapsa halophila]